MRSRARRLGRFLIYGGLSLLLVLILLVSAVHIEDRIFRSRAERLRDDILSIELRQTTFDQVDVFVKRWGDSSRRYGPCSKQHCDFYIDFTDPLFWNSGSKASLVAWHLHEWLGGHTSYARGIINVRNGFVWGKTYQIIVVVPTFMGPDGHLVSYGLIGRLTGVPRLDGGIEWPTSRRHPEYQIHRPSGCMSCVMVDVEFTPFADPADVRRLAQFNFSCLTGRRACRTREDIMPAAMAQASRENGLDLNESEQPSCDLQSVRIVSRLADNAAVVDIISSRPDHRYNPESSDRILEVQLVQRIKRATFWKLGAREEVEVVDVDTLPPLDGPSNLRPGARIIILFFDSFERAPDLNGPTVISGFPNLATEPCGVVPYSEDNLAVVREGAAEDDRVPPLYEYDPYYQPPKRLDLPLPPLPPPPPRF
jgi:hypothetical protein